MSSDIPLRRGQELLQRAIDRSELGIEIGAETIHRRDNRKRDARRDQTVFNRGCTRLIRQKLQEATPQIYLLTDRVDRGIYVEGERRRNTDDDLRLSKSVATNLIYN
jgi:hypothetical protein